MSRIASVVTELSARKQGTQGSRYVKANPFNPEDAPIRRKCEYCPTVLSLANQGDSCAVCRVKYKPTEAMKAAQYGCGGGYQFLGGQELNVWQELYGE